MKLRIFITVAALMSSLLSAGPAGQTRRELFAEKALLNATKKAAKAQDAKNAADDPEPCNPCCPPIQGLTVKSTAVVYPSSQVTTCELNKIARPVPRIKPATSTIPQQVSCNCPGSSSCVVESGVEFCTTNYATNSDSASQNAEPAMDVGTTQVLVNGKQRLRTFNKETMQPDNVLDVDMNRFFDCATYSYGSSDPIVVFDNDSQQWFLFGLSLSSGPAGSMPLAVSHCTDGTITADTVWTFYSLTGALVTNTDPLTTTAFLDYQKMAVDKNAVYMCDDTFDTIDTNFVDGTIVIANKAEILAGGPITITAFNGLNQGEFTYAGPFGTQCVMNYDTDPEGTSPFGWLVSADGSSTGGSLPLPFLYLYQVENVLPYTSPDLCRWDIEIPAYRANNPPFNRVALKGGLKKIASGFNAFSAMAHIRNGILWCIHELPVDINGDSDPSNPHIDRIGIRWYAVDVFNGGIGSPTPVLLDYGTICDRSSVTNPTNYWFPAMISNANTFPGSNGDMLITSSSGGKNNYWNFTAWTFRINPNPVTVGSGNLLIPNTQGTTLTNGVAWNPTQDFLGDNKSYRDGDYHRATVDPSDNITLWSTGEYAFDPINWGAPFTRVTFPVDANATPKAVKRPVNQKQGTNLSKMRPLLKDKQVTQEQPKQEQPKQPQLNLPRSR